MGDAVLAHLASRVAPGIDVVFLDTGYHFVETIGTRDAVAATMPVNVVTLSPTISVRQQDEQYGTDLCDRPRPVLRAAQGPAAGRGRSPSTTPGPPACAATRPTTGSSRRSSAGTRRKRKVKVSPLARWTDDDVDRYIAENDVLVNPLLYDGYPSIGCGPCTRRVAPGDDARSGRWAGTSKTECGIHS